MINKHTNIFTSTLYQTTTTCIRTANAIFLIDPNWLPAEIEKIKEHVETIQNNRRLYLIFTHADYDHIIGYGAFPGATTIASKAFKEYSNKSGQISKCEEFDQKYYISRDYVHSYPEVDIPIITDGKSMHFSGSVATFYLAPGHTQEGIFIIFEPHGIWVAGDYFSDIEIPFIENVEAYKRTLQKTERILRHHQIQYLIPGHGTVAHSREEILQRRDQSLEYIDDLEQSIQDQTPFPLEKYKTRYFYWQGITSEHDRNFRLLSG